MTFHELFTTDTAGVSSRSRTTAFEPAVPRVAMSTAPVATRKPANSKTAVRLEIAGCECDESVGDHFMLWVTRHLALVPLAFESSRLVQLEFGAGLSPVAHAHPLRRHHPPFEAAAVVFRIWSEYSKRSVSDSSTTAAMTT